MKLSQFNFNLPKDLIAQYPTLFRDDCRLMVVHRKTGEIEYDPYVEPEPVPIVKPESEEEKPKRKTAKKKDVVSPLKETKPAKEETPAAEAKPAKKASKKAAPKAEKPAEVAPEKEAPAAEAKPAKKTTKKAASKAEKPAEPEEKPAKAKAASKKKPASKAMSVNLDEGKAITEPVYKYQPREPKGKTFRNVIDYFDDKDLFIFNDTQVFPAKLYGNKERTGAVIEVFLLRELNPNLKLWDVLVEPARKIRIGNKLYFGEGENMVAEVIDNTTSRGRTLRFLYDGPHDQFKRDLYALGNTPLPEYITRKPDAEDAERYQTIFASKEGAVVAPAAGAHFSRELMRMMEIKGIESAFLTLHSGLGNFREIEVEDLTKHRMDSEQLEVSPELVKKVNETKDAGHKVCAVGASTLRALASAVSMNGHIKALSGWTNKFIFPPYEFTVADAYITNFHEPYSVMLMEAAAFGGYDLVMKAYKIAVKEKYKFGCYGDAMLIVD